MFRFHRRVQRTDNDQPLSSQLFDQDTFYPAFLNDLKSARNQVIIESPFITKKRMNILMPILNQLTKRGVRLIINTKPLDEHEPAYRSQTEESIAQLQEIGVLVLLTVGHHRKLAIIDQRVIWEGSLNILSQNDSCEVMRRVQSRKLAVEMVDFVKLGKFYELSTDFAIQRVGCSIIVNRK